MPSSSPAARLEQIFFFELADVEALHGLAEFVRGFEDFFCVLIIGGGIDDGLGALRRVAGFENAGADKDGFRSKLQYERGVRRSGDAAGGKIRHGQLAVRRDMLNKIERRAELLGFMNELFLA